MSEALANEIANTLKTAESNAALIATSAFVRTSLYQFVSTLAVFIVLIWILALVGVIGYVGAMVASILFIMVSYLLYLIYRTSYINAMSEQYGAARHQFVTQSQQVRQRLNDLVNSLSL